MAIYAIGDVHGCFTALCGIIESVPFEKGDTVVFVGDYVDRGPNSKDVLDWICNNSSKYNLVTIRGNHEIMMRGARDSSIDLDFWLRFGGRETLESYNLSPDPGWEEEIPAAHWTMIANTRRYYEHDKFVFVHAGITSGIPIDQQTDDVLFWQHKHEPMTAGEDRIVVCGHTRQQDGDITNFGSTIYIDTNCYGGKWLTCLNVESGQWWQADQKGSRREGNIEIGGFN